MPYTYRRTKGHPFLLLFRDSEGINTHRFILYTAAAIAIPNTMHKDTLLSEAINGKLVSVTDAALPVDFFVPYPVQHKYKSSQNIIRSTYLY